MTKSKAEKRSTRFLATATENSTASSQAEPIQCTLCCEPIDGAVVFLNELWEYHPDCAVQELRATAENEARMQRLRDAGWKEEKCGACGGHGQTWVGDSSPDGLADCNCNNGYYWVTPKGRHALWPGGPFCGRS